MIVKKVKIQSSDGLHARPAAEIAKLASKFKSEVFIIKNGKKVNAKSVLGILTLVAGSGTELEISVNGSDEVAAISALIRLINNNFNETEIKKR